MSEELKKEIKTEIDNTIKKLVKEEVDNYLKPKNTYLKENNQILND